MNDEEQYAAAIARCKAGARNHGHTLGEWLLVDERLHASMCEICGAMAWVALPGYEERWRVGGTALQQGCLEEDQSLELGP